MTRLLCGTLVANVLLLTPVWLQHLSFAPAWLALEALIIVPLLSLPAHTWARPLRWLAVTAVLLAFVVGVGDAVTRHVLGRPLNLWLDLPLLAGAYDLLTGVLGSLAAIALAAAALALLVAACVGLYRAATRLQGSAHTRPSMAAALFMLTIGTATLAAQLAQERGPSLAEVPLVDTFSIQVQQFQATQRERAAFEADLSADTGHVKALDGLAGRDVILMFVESYGADIVDRQPWRKWLAPRLAEMDDRLGRAGLGVVSGAMISPIRGGQSWLAHATAMSGMLIDNTYRYRTLLSGQRPTLVDDFRATGHRAMAIAPAITKAWPEGRAYDFDSIHAAEDLGYGGPALNWVTMPDQYTLYRFQQLRQQSREPTFAMISLISSHAPWTPILPVLEDWDSIGDGQVFRKWQDAGTAPEVLWQDLDEVRQHHARALDYTLGVITSWAVEFLEHDDLLIVLGDHPAAPLISGDEAGNAVPMHVISGDQDMLAPFAARGFASGTEPHIAGQTPPGMARLRDWLHADFVQGEAAQSATQPEQRTR